MLLFTAGQGALGSQGHTINVLVIVKCNRPFFLD